MTLLNLSNLKNEMNVAELIDALEWFERAYGYEDDEILTVTPFNFLSKLGNKSLCKKVVPTA